MEKARRPGAAQFDDLDDIVAEVFASLDGSDAVEDEEAIAPRRPIEQRNGAQRRTTASPERRDPAEVVEAGVEQPSSQPEEVAEHSFSEYAGAPANAELPAGGLRSAGSLASKPRHGSQPVRTPNV